MMQGRENKIDLVFPHKVCSRVTEGLRKELLTEIRQLTCSKGTKGWQSQRFVTGSELGDLLSGHPQTLPPSGRR